jgi:stage V sporulation protein K
MTEVKDQVEQMVYLSSVSKKRKEMNLKSAPQSLHMIFTGNPGTGKTTAARLIGEAFASMGLLKSRGEIPFVEVRQDEIAHPHVGQGEKNMVSKFKEAKGGVLFLDEAYSFIGKAEHRSAEKIVAAIVQCMEDMRDEVLVIAAGYEKEMQSFISFNPGLNSRFPTRIRFPDYSVPELIRIAEQLASDQDYVLSNDYKDALTSVLYVEKSRPHFGNARTVRNHIERSIRRQAVRLSNLTTVRRNDLMTVIASDLVASVIGTQIAEKEALNKIITEAQKRLRAIELKEFLLG